MRLYMFCKYPERLFLQNVCSGFEFDNLLGFDGDLLAGAGVVTLSGFAGGGGEGAEAHESDLTVFLQFSFGNCDGSVKGFLGVNFGHAGFCSNGID